MTSPSSRVERDFLGDRDIPAGSYWGVHTARALENFSVSGTPVSVHRELVAALGAVKQAAVRANRDLGLVDERRADAIDRACQEVRDGLLDDQFVVDVIQGGAGTSTNMNTNEVVANRALELLGLPAGRYDEVHPLDHVNRSQSTNDVYPTAVRLSLLAALDGLSTAVHVLAEACKEKSREFWSVPKVGRTQLQDAVPMTIGQEFAAWGATLAEEEARIHDTRGLLREVNLGATAIGTGITADPGYREAVCRRLREITGLQLVTAPDLIEATSDAGVFVQLSGVLKRIAVKVSKICNDLRLLSSGPQAGFGELRLPPLQAGSSIMPGKVNPVIPEMVNQVAFAVVGNDVTVTMAAEAGQLQLNAFEPVIAHTLLESIGWMTTAFERLATQCINGIEVDVEHLESVTGRSVGVVTALTPYIGYVAAADIVKAALSGGGNIRDLVLATGLVDPNLLEELLHPERLAGISTVSTVATVETGRSPMSDPHAPSNLPGANSATAPDLAGLLARYQQAWSEGDIEGILSMTPADGVYEASFGPHPWGQRFVGHDEIRAALLDMGLDQPGRSRHEYGETHVVGDCAFALWTSVQDGPTGSETTMHGADLYRFRDGMVAAKVAYRKNRQS